MLNKGSFVVLAAFAFLLLSGGGGTLQNATLAQAPHPGLGEEAEEIRKYKFINGEIWQSPLVGYVCRFKRDYTGLHSRPAWSLREMLIVFGQEGDRVLVRNLAGTGRFRLWPRFLPFWGGIIGPNGFLPVPCTGHTLGFVGEPLEVTIWPAAGGPVIRYAVEAGGTFGIQATCRPGRIWECLGPDEPVEWQSDPHSEGTAQNFQYSGGGYMLVQVDTRPRSMHVSYLQGKPFTVDWNVSIGLQATGAVYMATNDAGSWARARWTVELSSDLPGFPQELPAWNPGWEDHGAGYPQQFWWLYTADGMPVRWELHYEQDGNVWRTGDVFKVHVLAEVMLWARGVFWKETEEGEEAILTKIRAALVPTMTGGRLVRPYLVTYYPF